MFQIHNLDKFQSVGMLVCGNSRGTAFLVDYHQHQYLVTDYHVLHDRDNRIISDNCEVIFFNQSIDYYNATHLTIDFGILSEERKIEDVAKDLAIYRVDGNPDAISWQKKLGVIKGLSLSDVSLYDLWGKHSVIYGHPTSAKRPVPFDKKPFLTNGIVSAIDEDQQLFVVDSPVYYGNSGSPVFLKRCGLTLIGIVQNLIPFNLEWHIQYEDIVRTDWHNTGYSVCRSSNVIKQLIDGL